VYTHHSTLEHQTALPYTVLTNRTLWWWIRAVFSVRQELKCYILLTWKSCFRAHINTSSAQETQPVGRGRHWFDEITSSQTLPGWTRIEHQDGREREKEKKKTPPNACHSNMTQGCRLLPRRTRRPEQVHRTFNDFTQRSLQKIGKLNCRSPFRRKASNRKTGKQITGTLRSLNMGCSVERSQYIP